MVTKMLALLCQLCLFVWTVKAHMEMTSKFDTANANPDYSMTSPLATDGTNFPCKGYLSRSDAHTTASFSAGQFANFSLTGSATHGGGSCQVSLSYDSGKTFKVINSILGGCPLQDTYNFQFPSGLPGGKQVVFSWSWMNKIGNREFYQNCALVDIVGTGYQSFLNTLPDMQVANVGTGCTTVESIEVIPMNPGSSIQYGGSYSAGASSVNGQFGAGLTGSCGSATTNNVGAGNVNTPVQVASTSTTSKIASTVKTTTPTSAPAPAPVATTVASNKCQEGLIVCVGTGYTWSICSGGSLVSMGAVAPGTVCRDGAMVMDTPQAIPVVASTSTSKQMTTIVSTTKALAARPAVVTQTKATIATSNCFTKRDDRPLCEEYAIKCHATSETHYYMCSRGVWGLARVLSLGEICANDLIIQVDSAIQSPINNRRFCTRTGISCSEDGRSYYLCDLPSPLSTPVGLRCMDGDNGGGFVSWHAA